MISINLRRSAEASDLGLAVGAWPAAFHVDNVEYRRVRVSRDADGDVTSVLYRTADGRELEVFND
jgi:hypothetical protein